MQNRLQPKKIRRGIIMVVALGLLAALIISILTIDADTLRAFAKIHPTYLIYALLAIFVSWFFSALAFYVLARIINKPLGIKDSAIVYLGGSFVGFITPFGSGLLPTQILILSAKGLSAGEAAAVTGARATISAWLFGAIGLIMFLAFRSQLPRSSTAILLGIMALAVIWSLLIMFFIKLPDNAKRFVTRITAIRLLSKRFGEERRARARERLYSEIMYLSTNLKDIFSIKNSLSIATVFLIEVVAWMGLFAVLPLILFGFNITENSPNILFRLFILFTVAPVSPTPGGSGLVELAFTGFLINLVPRTIIGLVVLIWRALTYYLTLFVGGVVMLRFATKSALAITMEDNDD